MRAKMPRLCCACAFGCAASMLFSTATSAGTPIDVYVLCGQSNMYGSGVVSQLDPSLALQEDVLYQFNLDDGNWVSEGWGPLRELSQLGPSFGLELQFGRTIADADPLVHNAIIKIAVNGSAIRRWVPGGVYWPTLENFTADALTDLESMGYTPAVRAFVWVQGSNDANSETHSALYEQRLDELAGGVRGLWGTDVRFAQSQQYCCGPFVQEQIDAVRAAKEAFTADDAKATLTETDDLTMRSDMIHFTWRSLLVLGDRLAADLLAHRPEDINGDGVIDTADLGQLINMFGDAGATRADLNGDGIVGMADLGLLLGMFGEDSAS